MHLGLKDKGVVVLGSSKGLGLAIAEAFYKEGAKVAICGRTAKNIIDGKAHFHYSSVCDVTDTEALTDFIKTAYTVLGSINVLICNASGIVFDFDKLTTGNTDEVWQTTFETDLMSYVRATEYTAPLIEQSNGGSIIYISSVASMRPSKRKPAYGAIKAAINQYTQTQAIELAKMNIRVNTIAPGSVDIPGGSLDKARIDNNDLVNYMESTIPAGRFGTVDDISAVALFLASQPGSWITGQVIVADGGQILV